MDLTPDKLPRSLQTFLSAVRGGDSHLAESCFAEDASVHVDGCYHKEVAAIREWLTESRDRYHLELLEVQVGDDNVMILAQLSGDFPGSPTEFDYLSRLREEKITNLDIE